MKHVCAGKDDLCVDAKRFPADRARGGGAAERLEVEEGGE